jgi:hypothetical protein
MQTLYMDWYILVLYSMSPSSSLLLVIVNVSPRAENRVTPAVRMAPDPAQNGGAVRTLASATGMKAVNPAQATPIRDKGVVAPLATWTAPDLSRDIGTVGAAPEADATAVKNPVAPARGAGALAEAEMRKSMTTVTPRKRKSEETREAAAEQPLPGAAGRPVGKTSEGISLGTRSRARSCRA